MDGRAGGYEREADIAEGKAWRAQAITYVTYVNQARPGIQASKRKRKLTGRWVRV